MLSNDKPATSISALRYESEFIDYLDQRRGKILSRTGGWFPGKGVFSHGYSMLEELVGSKSYFQVLILNATGRLVERPLADWLEAAFTCLSWPDPRIWCNQIGALAGSVRTSVTAATVMGALAADSRIYGSFTILGGMEFIQDAMQKARSGLTAAEIVSSMQPQRGGKPLILGYFRPIAKGDERIPAMERVGRELGFAVGEHLQLAYQIEEVLRNNYDEGMNINGYASAFLSDQGFSPQQAYQMISMLVASGVTACCVDSLQRPADTFLPLRCNDIEYKGEPLRPVPD
ncbi:MAG TPA: hypothetical protein VN030_15735 [Cellvibrio sp.]|nr:hypothetical protein [Cellvibrio sp.]